MEIVSLVNESKPLYWLSILSRRHLPIRFELAIEVSLVVITDFLHN